MLDDDGNAFLEYQDGVQVDSTTENVSIGISTQPFRIGGNSPTLDHYYNGLIDDLRVYDTALDEAQIKIAMAGGGLINEFAAVPVPEDGATDVPRDVTLGWMPGGFAGTHDVYLGIAAEDVGAADRANPLGVMAKQDHDANTYDPAGVLQFGQTYYWRVDEVNVPPSDAIFKGNVWSFTVEPFAYPIQNIVAAASIPNVGPVTPQNTIDGSGLNEADLHSSDSGQMWLGNGAAGGPVWILYQFDRTYKLREMWVWNSNSAFEPAAGFGLKDVTIESSMDGTDWTAFGVGHQFARAPGAGGYAHNTTIALDGLATRYLRINVQGNWGGLSQYGLSEVRFYYVPTQAREPQPPAGATGVKPDVILNWRAGRDADSHEVYMSTSREMVADPGPADPTEILSQNSYVPNSLELGLTYYWRVDEVNLAEAISTWPGDVWSFATAEYLVVDDFEAYTDNSPRRVFQTWRDGAGFSADPFFPSGYDGNGTGSLVGYDPSFGHIMETTIVHGGGKSMPFEYNNTASVTRSETTRTFDNAQDWTRAGIRTLVLYFYGDPGNAAATLYVKVNDTRIVYGGDPANLAQESWNQWNVDLSAVAASSLKSLKTLTLGVETGGAGKLLIDDIRLYRIVP